MISETQETETNYEYVNHPKHYNTYDIEVIDMMKKIFGVQATIDFCKLNAFKYRMRVGSKPNISIEEDLAKEKWYLDKMNEIQSRFNLAASLTQSLNK